MNQITTNQPASPGLIWLRAAAVYFVVGVGLGIAMGVADDFSLVPVHAHVNLLGWVSAALIGLIYDRLPQLGGKRLARVQFVLHNLGLPVQMIGVAGKLRGIDHMEPLIGVGSVLVAASVLLLAWNLLVATRGAGGLARAATAAIN